MSIFKYTLPSGATFVVNGPANATQEQADAIFYSQVAAGTFAGYSAGQTLSSITSSLTNFGLTRLERGTAGVDNRSILSITNTNSITTQLGNVQQLSRAINSGLSDLFNSESSLVTSLGPENQVLLSVINGLPVIANVPSFVAIPLSDPVDQADVALAAIPLGISNVGALSPIQVQSIQAQAINLINQNCNVVTQSRGIGKFGFNCQQLEQAGYVKPGTTQRFLNSDYAPYLPNAENFVGLMNSPSIWTNKNGVRSLDDLLSNCDLQSQIYTELMQSGYNSLIAAGIIVPPPSSDDQPITATVYSQSSQDGGSLSSLSNEALLSGSTAVTTNPINLVGNLLTSNVSSGNNLSNIGSLVTGATASTGNVISKAIGGISLTSLASVVSSSLTKLVSGDLGALTLNATQFGTPLTSVWASAGNLTRLQGQAPNFNNLPGQLPTLNSITATTGQIPSLSGLTNQLPSLSSLTSGLPSLNTLSSQLPNLNTLTNNLGNYSGLMNNLGAMGSFASAFGGGGGGESPGSLVSNEQPAPAYNRTVNRSTVDIAVSKILGNKKIPTPKFGLDSDSSLGASADILFAQNNLKRLGVFSTDPSTQVFGSTVTI